MPYWILSAISIICLHDPFARYFKMSKYVVLDTERYNNKILPILKNDISTFLLQTFFNNFDLSPFRIIHIYTSRYLTRGELKGKSQVVPHSKKIIHKKHLIVTVSSIIFSIKILWYKKHQFYLRKMTSCVFFS